MSNESTIIKRVWQILGAVFEVVFFRNPQNKSLKGFMERLNIEIRRGNTECRKIRAFIFDELVLM